MYYIDRLELTDASFLPGSVAEPSATEQAWVSGGTYAVGDERIRAGLHRVFKCAAPRSPSSTPPSTTAPEDDSTGWVDMRPTDRYLPFGPMVRADGLTVYQSAALELVGADIEYRVLARYASSIALFGLLGQAWRVQVYEAPGGALRDDRSGPIKQPATGYWDYCFGKRRIRDRVLITGLPMAPNAEIRITISAGVGATRRLSQCEIGPLRFLPGTQRGGTEYGISRDPRAYTYRKDEANGDVSILIYGTTYNLSGVVALDGRNEDSALRQLRDLIGKGRAYTPALIPGYEQSLVFGLLTSAPTSRDNVHNASTKFEIEGLPT